MSAPSDAVPDLTRLDCHDAHHHIVRVNLSMAKSSGAKPEDLVGRACYEVHASELWPIDTVPPLKATE